MDFHSSLTWLGLRLICRYCSGAAGVAETERRADGNSQAAGRYFSASATSSDAFMPSARASLAMVLIVGWFCPFSISEMKLR